MFVCVHLVWVYIYVSACGGQRVMSVFFSVDLYLVCVCVFLRQSFLLNLELNVLIRPSNPRDLPISAFLSLRL